MRPGTILGGLDATARSKAVLFGERHEISDVEYGEGLNVRPRVTERHPSRHLTTVAGAMLRGCVSGVGLVELAKRRRVAVAPVYRSKALNSSCNPYG